MDVVSRYLRTRTFCQILVDVLVNITTQNVYARLHIYTNTHPNKNNDKNSTTIYIYIKTRKLTTK